MFLLSHLFIYSVIYLSVQTHEYLFYSLGHTPTLPYFVAQIVEQFVFKKANPFQLAPVPFDLHAPL